jgi:hypothetical protein
MEFTTKVLLEFLNQMRSLFSALVLQMAIPSAKGGKGLNKLFPYHVPFFLAINNKIFYFRLKTLHVYYNKFNTNT